ncbi:MAG TPA: L-glutamate gamma-semialdehyde dehydrogenase [Vicinamibacterales bacterium]|nr:L-glutamate gamma-semialdehyde dehydrogenase [Vicinamibacterales bacterium]
MPLDATLNAIRRPPTPLNEPVRSYAPGTPDRAALRARLDAMAGERVDIPLVIGGRDVRTGRTRPVVMPCDHGHVLADCHQAGPREIARAIESARVAQREWAAWPWEDRAAVFLKAAELVAGSRRATLNAATMLGQGKTVHQAEIDAACELVDFWRFNVAYAADLVTAQPDNSAGVWNQLDYRPLEGFVYAISPFNFTAIAGNLPTAPVLMGGVAIWKPASAAVLSAHDIMRALVEAGLPPGVINFVPGPASVVSDALLASPDLAGIHFTGSTAVFQGLWQAVGVNLARYRNYPRVVGETGGKDFVLLHPSADPQAAAVAIVRGGFEYQGQKCSAASRIYVPRSLWKDVRDRVVAMMRAITMGDVRDFSHFMGAVIDRAAFDRIRGYLVHAKRTARIVEGGRADGRRGYFIAPTLVEVSDPAHRLMREEVFGPVVAAYVYPDRRWTETLDLVDRTSPYALTGSIFARDRRAVREATAALRYAAGNFYVNDKPTGAVVGQQPFGGARASGTNDKAGSPLNLLRWVSARTIKETLAPPDDYRYPYMADD